MSGGGVGATTQLLGRDAHAGDVADAARRRCLVQVADVVGGVAGRVGDAEALDALVAVQHAQVGLGHRHDLAPQAVELLAVQAPRAGHQALGVDHVRRAALVDVDRQLGPAAHERAARAGVVEVDVGQQQRARTLVAEPASSVSTRRLGPGVDEHAADLAAADDAVDPQVLDVELAHAWQRSQRAATRPPPAPRSLPRGVAVMQHQVVAVRVPEQRHVADPGVERLPEELDALGLELRARGGDVVDVQRGVGVSLRRELHPHVARGSQMPKQVSPAHTSKRALSSGRRPSVST